MFCNYNRVVVVFMKLSDDKIHYLINVQITYK
jgi:hypothetical protein